MMKQSSSKSALTNKDKQQKDSVLEDKKYGNEPIQAQEPSKINDVNPELFSEFYGPDSPQKSKINEPVQSKDVEIVESVRSSRNL